MNTKLDYYQILHVHPEAPREIIKSSYRTLMQRMRMHPDLGGDNASAAIINEAYAVLMEPAQREAYDQSRLSGAANDSVAPDYANSQSSSTGNAQASGESAADEGACQFCRAPFAPANANAGAEFCGQCESPRFIAAQVSDDALDRRAILRVPKNCSLVFFTHWPQTDAYPARSEDVSLTGMRFTSSIGLEIDQVIKIDTQMLRAVAQVTRMIRRGGQWEIGARFLSLHFERARGSFVADCV